MDAKGWNDFLHKEFKLTGKLSLVKQAITTQREKCHSLEIFMRRKGSLWTLWMALPFLLYKPKPMMKKMCPKCLGILVFPPTQQSECPKLKDRPSTLRARPQVMTRINLDILPNHQCVRVCWWWIPEVPSFWIKTGLEMSRFLPTRFRYSNTRIGIANKFSATIHFVCTYTKWIEQDQWDNNAHWVLLYKTCHMQSTILSAFYY